MPNYAHAGFNVTGDPNELQRFAQMMIRPAAEVGMIARIEPPSPPEAGATGPEKLTLDFNGIIPSPPADTLMDWEGWAVENWGTKWNARDVDVRVDPHNIWFQFSTAWAFPTPVFEALAAEFPTLVFAGSAYFDNDDLEFTGEFNGDEPWGPGKIEWIKFDDEDDDEGNENEDDASDPPF